METSPAPEEIQERTETNWYVYIVVIVELAARVDISQLILGSLDTASNITEAAWNSERMVQNPLKHSKSLGNEFALSSGQTWLLLVLHELAR